MRHTALLLCIAFFGTMCLIIGMTMPMWKGKVGGQSINPFRVAGDQSSTLNIGFCKSYKSRLRAIQAFIIIATILAIIAFLLAMVSLVVNMHILVLVGAVLCIVAGICAIVSWAIMAGTRNGAMCKKQTLGIGSKASVAYKYGPGFILSIIGSFILLLGGIGALALAFMAGKGGGKTVTRTTTSTVTRSGPEEY